MKTATPKGFRDFLPNQANARQFVVGKIIETFRLFGFEPLETPALEFTETLMGKYGEDEKLIYSFETKGGDKLALRYDQTVPLARVIAQYAELSKPFKRYQVQPVWRGENPQKGRFREFLQCDVDTVGSDSPLSDAEIISCALTVAKNLGFKDAFMEINDRTNFGNLESKYVSAIDKLKKIGEDGVLEELVSKGMSKDEATRVLDNIKTKQPNDNLKQIFQILEQMGFKVGENFKFSPTLARGLDYYTSTVFELVTPESNNSLAGGGRFDELIGRYSGIDTPAVGISFGFDRIVEVMSDLQLLPNLVSSAKVLVTIFSKELLNKSVGVSSLLRSNNINTEIWLDSENRLDKQLKYADQKGIPYVVIIGPEEAEKGTATLKNLSNKTQEVIPLDELASKLSS